MGTAAYVAWLVTWFLVPGRMEELREQPSAAESVGTFIGSALGGFLIPMMVVGIASIWRGNRTEPRRFMIFTGTLVVLFALQGTFIVLGALGTGSGAAWRYDAPDRTFSLTLPSASWKPVPHQTHVADFWFPDVAPMLASVISVTEQGLDDYHARVAAARASASGSGDKLRRSTGYTVDGDPYFLQCITESRSEMQGRIYAAQCFCRLAKPGLLVALIFERQGKAFSDAGRTLERREFESQVEAICTSVRAFSPSSE